MVQSLHICDFGIAVRGRDDTGTIIGTSGYISPEALLGGSSFDPKQADSLISFFLIFFLLTSQSLFLWCHIS